MKKPGHKTIVHKMIAAAFGNLEVKDAVTPLLLVPTEDDFKSAVRKDPKNCGLSRCVGRMFGATLALFFKRFAYIDMVGEDGKRRVWRFVVSEPARKQLSAFDRAEHVKTERAIRLLPPSPGRSMAGMRKTNMRWRRSDVGKAVAAETKARSSLRVAEREAERAQSRYVEAKAEHGSSSPVLRMAEKQKAAATTELRKARDKVAVTVERSKKLRSISFRNTEAPKPRKFDLTVRNATGFFSRAEAA
jgi:hypothetical protein